MRKDHSRKDYLANLTNFKNSLISLQIYCLFLPCFYKFMVVGVTGANGAIVQRQSVAYKSGPENVIIQNQDMAVNVVVETE